MSGLDKQFLMNASDKQFLRRLREQLEKDEEVSQKDGDRLILILIQDAIEKRANN